ncbi:MAG TPA: FkbM family methyltransferase [Candidatus Dormibacteraeota bacterium]|nr:FkbM family methyltransferase [Candidatus Dormibacteraeota bacterium]
MLYRAGFSHVYQVAELPDHDDFRDAPDHERHRTVLLGSVAALHIPGLVPVGEPRYVGDPWAKPVAKVSGLLQPIQQFLAKPLAGKIASAARRFQRLFPKVPVPIRLSFGAWWLVRGSTLDERLLSGHFETGEIRFVERYLRPGMIVLDIGAHHGLYTLLASKNVGPEGKVIAFEPSVRECERLRQHVRLNSCSNVRIEPIAIGAERSRGKLFVVDGAEDWCNSLRPPAVVGSGRSELVDVLPLDEYLSGAGITSADFLKLDVEGAELEVLRGARELLRKPARPVILAEVYDIRTLPWGYPASKIVGHLDKLGFKWFQLRADGTLQSVASDRDVYDCNLVAIPSERMDRATKTLAGK